MLKMRLTEGVDLLEFKDKFALKLPKELYTKISNLEKAGILNRCGEKISFTPKGFLVSNSVISDLLFTLEAYD